MTKISETGHAKTLANFDELVSFVSAYGTVYNPSNPSLSLAALQTLSGDSRNALIALNSTLPVFSNAVAARDVAFEPLNKLVTRLMNALKAIDTSVQVDDNAKTLARKIQGKRASAKKTEEEKLTLAAEGNEIKEISSSQLSHDNRLENFDRLIKLLASIPGYSPNEEDLKVTGLTALYNDLMSKNAAVVAAATTLSNARIARNNVLYKADTGLADIALAVKAYVKSLFGATSPQYKQVSKVAIINKMA
jgi:ADP-heptose:LPS heptosyltransferase